MKIYFIALFFIPMLSYGQEVTYRQFSLETMISNFYHEPNTPTPNTGIDQYDKLIGYESGDGILMDSPLKYLPEKDSMKNVHAEWEISYSDPSKPCLRLKRILPIGISKDKAREYEEHLAQLYGKNKQKICATWFTESLFLYRCPQNLFGEWISDAKTVLNIKNGFVLEQKHERIRAGSMANYFSKRQQANNNIRIALAGYNDGCWVYGNDHRAKALSLFVNDSLSISNCPDIRKEFSLLLYTDSTGVSTIHILQPRELNTNEQKLIMELKKLIAKLPKWSFGWMETIQGDVFPGCYLQAEYSKEKGWEFKDYVCKNMTDIN